MNRYTTQFVNVFEKKVVDVFAKVSFGASGAPTLDRVNSKGVVSVTRNGTGDYTFVFGTKVGMLDTYVKLLCARHIFNSGSAAPAAPGMYIKANSVSVVNTSSLRVVFNAAGTAADPASGEIVYIEFIFSDSTAP